MSDMAQSKLVVLWEHEIRLAAGLVAAAYEALKKKDRTPEEESEALTDAFNACLAALHGADDPEVTLVLSAVPDVVKARRHSLSKHKGNLIAFLATVESATRGEITAATGIPEGSLSELLRGDEFQRIERGQWKLK